MTTITSAPNLLESARALVGVRPLQIRYRTQASRIFRRAAFLSTQEASYAHHARPECRARRYRSVRQLKGNGRPVYPAGERARILAALEAVDYVVVFEETRAEKIIRAVKPDVLIKGEDWRGKEVDGQAFVESRGGRVALAPLLGGRSTSAIIDRMNSRATKNGA